LSNESSTKPSFTLSYGQVAASSGKLDKQTNDKILRTHEIIISPVIFQDEMVQKSVFALNQKRVPHPNHKRALATIYQESVKRREMPVVLGQIEG
jgi:hypothetical protein